MGSKRVVNDAVHWYMNELTSTIVARSGRATDRFHMGKMLLECLRRYPDAILQVSIEVVTITLIIILYRVT